MKQKKKKKNYAQHNAPYVIVIATDACYTRFSPCGGTRIRKKTMALSKQAGNSSCNTLLPTYFLTNAFSSLE